ncbi:transmembrane protein 253 [Acipenser oxyrinchus oxyrinchus]|uniref:Transmembrane protein 253 n=1 Tax=Acipenser oxyrinchus oxyrinchus TaxID=40147 RepID=A0AAD8CMK1_ACIOX|nr:transmembrane protein 253 [Acipenser oxyrinchus oxyrinchus]
MNFNGFQEGLHEVGVMESPDTREVDMESIATEAREARITRWFGTVVNTRLLVTGVIQIFSAVTIIPTTLSFICMDFGCAVSMTTPMWAAISYLVSGSLAVEVQRRPKKAKVTALMVLNMFSLLLGLCAMITYGLQMAIEPKLLTREQKIGVYVAKGTAVFFTLQCLVASVYTLFLIWRGVNKYPWNYSATYSQLKEEVSYDDGARRPSEESKP